MLNLRLKDYIEAEIPPLKKYNGILKPIMLRRILKFNPSYDAVYKLRYCQLFLRGKNPVRKLISKRYKRLLVYRYGLYFSVSSNTVIGKGLRFPHPTSIVIGEGVTLGENCIIYQNVTVGGVRCGSTGDNRYPTVGNGCVLYAGCKVLGGITVSDGTQIGANAVLLKSTESDSTYAGVPARKIK